MVVFLNYLCYNLLVWNNFICANCFEKITRKLIMIGYLSFLKKVPGLVPLKKKLWQYLNFDKRFGKTKLNLLNTFPLFQPFSAGSYKDRSQLTIQTINQIFPFLSAFVQTIKGRLLVVENITDFPKTAIEKNSVKSLKEFLDSHGSDKANFHNYHYLYGSLLSNTNSINNIFEIGLGSNNIDVVSNMGAHGKPGASLRAFRDFCPNANIFGADIDEKILFEDVRIKTFFVDQTQPNTFASISNIVPKDFDLVIDDGLHSPNANIESLRFGLGIVKCGGWVVIEDIGFEVLPFWHVVAALLVPQYRCHILKSEKALIFAVQRLS